MEWEKIKSDTVGTTTYKKIVGLEKMHALGAKVNLVVCRKSNVQYWIDYFKKHYSVQDGMNDFEYLLFDLTDPDYLYCFVENAATSHCKEIGVINYDLVSRRPELEQLKDFTLMLDESSLIKSEMSERSKFILRKLKPGNVILLSEIPTCKTCYWRYTCPEWTRLYPCRMFEDTRGGDGNGQATQVGRSSTKEISTAPEGCQADADRGLQPGGDQARDTDQRLQRG